MAAGRTDSTCCVHALGAQACWPHAAHRSATLFPTFVERWFFKEENGISRQFGKVPCSLAFLSGIPAADEKRLHSLSSLCEKEEKRASGLASPVSEQMIGFSGIQMEEGCCLKQETRHLALRMLSAFH